MAKTVENFYQESGRGGRDGLPAKSLLYYDEGTVRTYQFLSSSGKVSEYRAKRAASDPGGRRVRSD